MIYRYFPNGLQIYALFSSLQTFSRKISKILTNYPQFVQKLVVTTNYSQTFNFIGDEVDNISFPLSIACWSLAILSCGHSPLETYLERILTLSLKYTIYPNRFFLLWQVFTVRIADNQFAKSNRRTSPWGMFDFLMASRVQVAYGWLT